MGRREEVVMQRREMVMKVEDLGRVAALKCGRDRRGGRASKKKTLPH